MKILILGYGRHGKDTFAEEFVKASAGTLSFASSSEFCAKNVVFPVLRDEHGYPDWEACFEDRANHRTRWHEIIAKYNTPSKTRLAREICDQHDIYVGMRSVHEYEACVREKIFDVVMWIDRSDHLPPESEDSCSIKPDSKTMTILNNNGSLEQLAYKAQMQWSCIEAYL